MELSEHQQFVFRGDMFRDKRLKFCLRLRHAVDEIRRLVALEHRFRVALTAGELAFIGTGQRERIAVIVFEFARNGRFHTLRSTVRVNVKIRALFGVFAGEQPPVSSFQRAFAAVIRAEHRHRMPKGREIKRLHTHKIFQFQTKQLHLRFPP